MIFKIGHMGQKKKSIALFVMLASLVTMGLTSNQVFAGIGNGFFFDKDKPLLGDWKCYNVEEFIVEEDNVDLLDQFVDEMYDLESVIKICTTVLKDSNDDPFWPASIIGEIFQTKGGVDIQHYVVYHLCDEDSIPSLNGFACLQPDEIDLPVRIDDQFGETFHEDPHVPVELWVPAEKRHNSNIFPQDHPFHYKSNSNSSNYNWNQP